MNTPIPNTTNLFITVRCTHKLTGESLDDSMLFRNKPAFLRDFAEKRPEPTLAGFLDAYIDERFKGLAEIGTNCTPSDFTFVLLSHRFIDHSEVKPVTITIRGVIPPHPKLPIPPCTIDITQHIDSLKLLVIGESDYQEYAHYLVRRLWTEHSHKTNIPPVILSVIAETLDLSQLEISILEQI